MKRVVATGKSVEDAVTSALVRLGVTRAQAIIRVVQEPVKGILGFIGGKDAEVEVSVALTPEETAKDFLSGTLRRMGIDDFRTRTKQGHEEGKLTVYFEIQCDEANLPVLIGRHGSTLDSLQYLLNVVANQGHENYLKIVVDAGDYRRRRKEGLERLAERAAIRAVKTSRSVTMDPMSASDRKMVHTYLQERTDVTTTSEGADPNRKVVVLPVVQSGPARSRPGTGRE